ncbi:conserved hypothetical protein [Rhodococcus sp. RD6.2]|nr:conserved hypothetical protein [Rhodococcus sp. RD6.2]
MADMTDLPRSWTLDEMTTRVAAMDGVRILVADAESGAPESAWGDMFVYDAGASAAAASAGAGIPFATIVVSDYPGFDTASDLDRLGVYRVNIHVGRDRFRDLVGYGPESSSSRRDEHDYREADRVLPHPVYAPQAWVSIVNPGPRTGDLVTSLLAEALAWSRRRG